MKITLKKIFRSDTNKKTGEKFTNQYGPYIKVGLKTEEHGDKWVNGFENDTTKNWKEGDVVEVDVSDSQYGLKFKTSKGGPTGNPANENAVMVGKDLQEIKDRLTALENASGITTLDRPYNAPVGKELPEIDLSKGEIPFQ